MRWQPFLTFRAAYPYRRVTELPGRKAATVRHRQPIASQLSVSGTTDCAKCAGVKYRHAHKVFDTPKALLAGAMQCAKEIAAKPPVAIWGTKQAVHYARDHSVDDALKQMAGCKARSGATSMCAKR